MNHGLDLNFMFDVLTQNNRPQSVLCKDFISYDWGRDLSKSHIWIHIRFHFCEIFSLLSFANAPKKLENTSWNCGWYKNPRYELRRCVRTRTRAMCGRACASEIHFENCAGCACVRLVLSMQCAITLLHTFLNWIVSKMLLFLLKTVLERPIPFRNIRFCFITLKML